MSENKIEGEYFNDGGEPVEESVSLPANDKQAGQAQAAGDPDRLLTSAEAATKVSLTARGLNGMAKNGSVAHYKLGREYRFLLKDLMELVKRIEKNRGF